MAKSASAKMFFQGKDGDWRKNVSINGEQKTLRVNQKSEEIETEETNDVDSGT